MTSPAAGGSRLPLLVGLIGAALAGASPIFVRGAEVGPIAAAAWRVWFALALLLPVSLVTARLRPGWPVVEMSAWSLALGVLFALDVILWQTSVTMTTIPTAAFLANLAPIFVAIINASLFRRVLTRRELAAVALGCVGAFLLALPDLAVSAGRWFGAALALTASATFAGLLIVSEHAPPAKGPLSRYLGMSAVALPIIVACAAAFDTEAIPRSAMGLAWLFAFAVFVHCLAFALFFWSTPRVGAIGSSVVNLAQPVMATVLGLAIFREDVRTLSVLGMCLISAALYTISTRGRKEPRSGPSAAQ